METVQGLHTGRAVGLSGMRAEHLKVWLQEATHEREPATTRWYTLVSMIELTFYEVGIQGEYRVIGLAEMILKMSTTIINNQLRATISLHDALHGFRQGRGEVTATPEVKLT